MESCPHLNGKIVNNYLNKSCHQLLSLFFSSVPGQRDQSCPHFACSASLYISLSSQTFQDRGACPRAERGVLPSEKVGTWGCAARFWKPLPYFRAKYVIFPSLFET